MSEGSNHPAAAKPPCEGGSGERGAINQSTDQPIHQSTPEGAVNLRDAGAVTRLFQQATELNLADPQRQGCLVELAAPGRVLMSGDLHDHSLNFQRLVKLAQLDRSPNHHLILHELTHGKHCVNDCDLSVRLVAKAAVLKRAYPRQVHLMLANHDVAQACGQQILKDGRSVTQAFADGIDYLYGDAAGDICAAMNAFVHSFALAVRLSNCILCAHSLPSAHWLKLFKPDIFNRSLTPADFLSGGQAYMMVWGRSHPPAVTDQLAQAWGVDLFVLGHQPAEMGYYIETPRALVLASDHDLGTALPMDLDKRYTMDDLEAALVPLNGIMI